jgi:hypothetical protein
VQMYDPPEILLERTCLQIYVTSQPHIGPRLARQTIYASLTWLSRKIGHARCAIVTAQWTFARDILALSVCWYDRCAYQNVSLAGAGRDSHDHTTILLTFAGEFCLDPQASSSHH